MEGIAIKTLLCLIVFVCVFLIASYDEVSARGPVAHFMVSGFISHESPNIASDIVSFHDPQTVVLIEAKSDGWAKIYTIAGDAWINLYTSRFMLPRTYGLHDYMGQETYNGTISRQAVYVLQLHGSWMEINTEFGPRWINLDFEPCASPLQEMMQSYGNTFAMFYMDVASGFTFMHNPDRSFSAASVNKIQHALYVYKRAERGELDMERIHTLRYGDRRGGTGTIQNMAYGTRFTTRDLLRHSIRLSDNTAFQMLARYYGLPGYLYFVREIGADENLVRNIRHSHITARDAGIWALEVYRYIQSAGTYSQSFRTDLMNTNMQVIQSAYPIANKYGWYSTFFHDLAIVFADSPYILVILSDRPQASHGAFHDISARVQAFHRTYFR